MTNEQREAIETLKEITENDLLNYWEGPEKPYNAIDTVLSLIKENQTEIEKYKALYDRALSDVVKADKQIDLMARAFKQNDVRTVEEIKQYFARLVEKE